MNIERMRRIQMIGVKIDNKNRRQIKQAFDNISFDRDKWNKKHKQLQKANKEKEQLNENK